MFFKKNPYKRILKDRKEFRPPGPTDHITEDKLKTVQDLLDKVIATQQRNRRKGTRAYKQLLQIRELLRKPTTIDALAGLFKQLYSPSALSKQMYSPLFPLLSTVKKEQPTKWQQMSGWLTRIFSRGLPMPPGSRRSP